jgi:hypothetical protein
MAMKEWHTSYNRDADGIRKHSAMMAPSFWPTWSELEEAIKGNRRADREALIESRGTASTGYAEQQRLNLKYRRRNQWWDHTVKWAERQREVRHLPEQAEKQTAADREQEEKQAKQFADLQAEALRIREKNQRLARLQAEAEYREAVTKYQTDRNRMAYEHDTQVFNLLRRIEMLTTTIRQLRRDREPGFGPQLGIIEIAIERCYDLLAQATKVQRSALSSEMALFQAPPSNNDETDKL